MITLEDLARRLVEARAFRWEAGMLTQGHRLDEDDFGGAAANGCYPILDDPATAACLAVQAMERGAAICYHPEAGLWEAMTPAGGGYLGTLGDAAASALLAMTGGSDD